jgi:hypothetical protein
MTQYALKIFVSAALLVAVAEASKRSTLLGALLVSLPLTSLLAFTWLYLDTGDTARIADLSIETVWMVVPSLALFVVLAWMLRAGHGFWLSLVVACAVTAACYAGATWLLAQVRSGPTSG